jgi:histidinol-phosphatase (PHP family)
MKKEDVSDYFLKLETLRKEYKNDINIYIGFEAEYYPLHFNDFLEFIKPFNPDYLILGQHFLNNEYDGVHSYRATDDEGILSLYVSQTIEALKTNCFTYFAHPDMINFTGDKKIYLREMKKVCDVAKELDIPLEINLLGVLENRIYPNRSFFEMAAKNGNKFIFGADAHTPENVYNKDVILKAEEFASSVGCSVESSVEFRPVFGG